MDTENYFGDIYKDYYDPSVVGNLTSNFGHVDEQFFMSLGLDPNEQINFQNWYQSNLGSLSTEEKSNAKQAYAKYVEQTKKDAREAQKAAALGAAQAASPAEQSVPASEAVGAEPAVGFGY